MRLGLNRLGYRGQTAIVLAVSLFGFLTIDLGETDSELGKVMVSP